MYDCIVVGAGPAGSTALRQLARQNIKGVLLERAELPRYKTCGGAISGITARELTDIPWETVAERSLSEIRVTHRMGRPLISKTPEPYARFVMRDRFDYLLTEAAVAAGGEVISGCRVEKITTDDDHVTVHTAKGAFSARTVIGADGANSVVAQAAGLPRGKLGAALEAEIHPPGSKLAAFSDHVYVSYAEPPWGYGWVFPKAEHLSVGIGTTRAPYRQMRKTLDRFIHRMGLAGNPMSITGHPIPVGGTPKQISTHRVLLAGDAAGLADPLSGEGIAHAVRSGKLAAHAVAAALESGNFSFATYQEQIQTEIVAELSIAWSIARKFYTFPRLFFWLFQKNRAVLEFYFDIVSGARGYSELNLLLQQEFGRFGLFRDQGSTTSITR